MLFNPQAPVESGEGNQRLPDLTPAQDNPLLTAQGDASKGAKPKVPHNPPKPQVKVNEDKIDLAYTYVKDNPCLYDKGN